jgi:hypothetical protein
MTRIAILFALVLLVALAGCGGSSTPTGDGPRLVSASQTVTVWSGDQQGWFNASIRNADTEFVAGPATPPLGDGSLQVTTGADLGAPVGGGVGGKGIFATEQFNGQKLADLTTLTYSTFQQQVAPTHPHLLPGFNVQVDTDGNGTRNTTLVFEPVYVPAQGAVAANTWQSWDALQGNGWWNTAGVPGFPGGGSTFFSLATFVAAYPNATIVTWYPSDNGWGFNFTSGQNSGGFWSNFIGNVDALTVGFGGDEITFDFELPTVDDCKKGGFEGLGFSNQGQCVKHFNAHGQNGAAHRHH